MKKHFVRFFSPGTYFPEETIKEIDSWDVEAAVEMARSIKERHAARPFGFRFQTRERGPEDLDSHISEQSNMYYLGGKIETREEIEARNNQADERLLSNMRRNGYDKIVTNTNSWEHTSGLKEGDVVLDVVL